MTYKNIVKMFLLLPIIVLCVYLANIHSKSQQPDPIVEATPVAKTVDQKQLRCLATNLYYEAGGEPTEGIAAVARVVMNRINYGFGKNPCQVVYQANMVKQVDEDTEETLWVKVCQFSWVCENKGNPNTSSRTYQKSLQVAYDVLAYDKYKEVIPTSTLYFHNTSIINPYPHEVVKKIGHHIFYNRHHDKRKRHVYKSGPVDVPAREVQASAQ